MASREDWRASHSIPRAGLAQHIVVRIRNNVLADVDNPADPLFKLVEVGGQQAYAPASLGCFRNPRK